MHIICNHIQQSMNIDLICEKKTFAAFLLFSFAFQTGVIDAKQKLLACF